MTENDRLNTLHILLAHERAIDAGEINAPNNLNSQEKEALQFILEEIQSYRAIGTVAELKSMKENGAFSGVELAQIACMQIKLKKYHEIGTIEKFKALKEKSEPKKILKREDFYKCPVCNHWVGFRYGYCDGCGQKLDWSE